MINSLDQYHRIILLYISNTVLAWGTAYKTLMNKVQTKINHFIRLYFLQDLLENKLLACMHLWYKGLLPNLFQGIFLYAGNVHGHNNRYASRKKILKYIYQKCEPILENKQ